MPRFFAIYAGRGFKGNQKLLNIEGAGRFRDHCWLHPKYNYIPSDIKVGDRIQVEAQIKEYEDRWTLTGIDDAERVP